MKEQLPTVLYAEDDPDDRFLAKEAWEQDGAANPVVSQNSGVVSVHRSGSSVALSDRGPVWKSDGDHEPHELGGKTGKAARRSYPQMLAEAGLGAA